MQSQSGIWPSPLAHLIKTRPDHPVAYLCPDALQARARRFQDGFDGLVTYAVKANPLPAVLDNLVATGIRAFDVASPAEIAATRAACPDASLHYNNPVRSRAEIAQALAAGVDSWSVDSSEELEKLRDVPGDAEIAVRFKLPVSGAAYDFGAKFGATPEAATTLLTQVARSGRQAALTFHPGTQCEDPRAWAIYIAEAARIARAAGVTLSRLNVGGGFPVARQAGDGDLTPVFDAIHAATRQSFGANAPRLICEPGRAMVGDAFTLAARIKAVRGDGTLFLNDGIYGGLSDMRDTGLTRRIRVFAPDGTQRHARETARVIFGPTCDSLDRLPDGMCLPADLQEGDYVLFDGMGAYSTCLSTAFNGYGLGPVETVMALSGH